MESLEEWGAGKCQQRGHVITTDVRGYLEAVDKYEE